MMRVARKELGLATSQTIMVGDTMETDILGGVLMGYRTILALSGATKEADLAQYAFEPDLVLPSIASLTEPDVDLLNVLPCGDGGDDSVHDLRQWAMAAS